MLSTGTMIQLGKVYSNLMVDVRSTNEKLIERSRQMLMDATDCDYQRAVTLLSAADGHVKSAIVMELLNVDYHEARQLLEKHEGHIRHLLTAKRED